MIRRSGRVLATSRRGRVQTYARWHQGLNESRSSPCEAVAQIVVDVEQRLSDSRP